MIIAFRLSKLTFGGTERVFISIASILSAQYGVQVHFVVDQIGYKGAEDVVREKGFKLISLNSNRTAASIFPLKNYIEIEMPSVLICAYTDTNMAALISAKIATHRCVTIVTEHSSLDDHWKSSSLIRRLILNCYVAIGYRLADHILGVSEGIALQLKRRLRSNKKVSYIHNPIRFFPENSIHNFVAKPFTRIKTVLAVGRISRPKDYLTLLGSFAKIISFHPANLVIVGAIEDLEEKNRLDNYIESNGLTPYVKFAGFTEDVTDYYKKADIFVLSSAWEGFGNVIVEALSFGLPVVSTNCNYGPAEILEDGKYGVLVPVGDTGALADAVIDLLDSGKKNNVLGPKRAMDFTEEKIGRLYWELIQGLLHKSQPIYGKA